MKNFLKACIFCFLLLPLYSAVAQSTNGNSNPSGRENWFPNRGNVGIGTRSPSEALEVLGNVRVSQTVFTNDLETVGLKATTLNVGQDAFIGRNLIVSGNVGIGVSNPSEKLAINGNLRVSAGIFSDLLTVRQFTASEGVVNNSLEVGQKFIVNGLTGMGVTSPTERLEVSGNVKISQGLYSDIVNSGDGSFSRSMQVTQNVFVRGNTGLGVASPVERFEVAGNAKISEGIFSNSVTSGDGLFSRNLQSNQDIIADGSIGIGTGTPAEKLDVVGNARISDGIFSNSITSGNGLFSRNLQSNQNIIADGSIGIGTATPAEKLDVIGNAKISQGLFSNSITSGDGLFSRSLRSNENIIVDGSIGIGTASPAEKLDVIGNIKSSADVLAANVRADKGYFSTLESNGNLTINGNVGIGVTSPVEKLEVAGNIKASQALLAQSAQVTQHISAGGNLSIAGNVGIGAVPGTDKLSVAGNAYVSGLLTAENLTVKQKLDLKGTFSVAGTLGVGVAAPEATLHVNGDGKFEGDVRANKIIVNAIEIAGATQTPEGGSSVSLGDNLFVNGSMGIGTTKTNGYKLSVDGKIRAGDDIKVYSSAEWSDFVFKKDYELRSLEEVARYIEAHGHLPEIPSAEQVRKEGIDVVAMDAKLLQKIEELTLYLIEMKKEVELQKKENLLLRNEIRQLSSKQK